MPEGNTDLDYPSSNRKATKRSNIEGFDRSDVNWRGVVNSAKERFPSKVEIVKDQRDDRVYISKVGKERLKSFIPIDQLGNNPAAAKYENKLLNLYRDANRTYTPPLNQGNNQSQSKTYEQQGGQEQRRRGEEKAQRQRQEEENALRQQQDFARKLQDQIRNSLQHHEDGGYDGASRVWRQPKPRPEYMPPFMQNARFKPY